MTEAVWFLAYFMGCWMLAALAGTALYSAWRAHGRILLDDDLDQWEAEMER